MKNPTLATPILMTAAVTSLVLANLSCGKTHTQTTSGANPPTTENPTSSTNTQVIGSTNLSVPSPGLQTNVPVSSAATDTASNSIATSDTATNGINTAPGLPTTPEPAPTSPATNPPIQVVEMPTTVPQAPQHFYGDDDSVTNHLQRLLSNDNYFLRARAGYEHTYHGDNNDTWYAGLKFYAYADDLRAWAGKNAWLIPDADLEFSHQSLAKPDVNNHSSGSDQGLNLQGNVTWPWIHWTTHALERTNCNCAYSQPLNFTLGPTANLGFDYLFDDNEARFARYFGARVAVNRLAYLEYTVGATDGLLGTRQQIVTEIPFYVTRDRQVQYTFRGVWNHGESSTPDVLQAGLFIEMPLDIVTHPGEWGDLIPFMQ